MNKRFELEKLPKDVSEKIHRIYFADTDGDYGRGILGQVHLVEGWAAPCGGRWLDFTSRADLIESIREEIREEGKVNS